MVEFVISVRTLEIGVSHCSNVVKKIGVFLLGVRMPEIHGNQRSNATIKNGQN